MITSQYEVLLCPWMPIWKRAEAIWALASDNLFAWQGRSWGQPHCHHLGFRHHLCRHIYNLCHYHHDMFVRGSKLLILDEATSSLDGDTDQHIGQLVEHQHQHLYLPMLTAVQWPTALFQLRDEFSECTILTIAHRLVGTTFYLSCFSYCWSSFWWREWSSQLHTVCLG